MAMIDADTFDIHRADTLSCKRKTICREQAPRVISGPSSILAR